MIDRYTYQVGFHLIWFGTFGQLCALARALLTTVYPYFVLPYYTMLLRSPANVNGRNTVMIYTLHGCYIAKVSNKEMPNEQSSSTIHLRYRTWSPFLVRAVLDQ